jgi:FKBP-type peptidyl-prolyl cis-trans isomerase
VKYAICMHGKSGVDIRHGVLFLPSGLSRSRFSCCSVIPPNATLHFDVELLGVK